jgi:hypothetical protein
MSNQPSLGWLSRLWASFHAINCSKDFCLRFGSANRLKAEILFQKRLRHWALQNFRFFENVITRLKQTGQVNSLYSHFIAITNITWSGYVTVVCRLMLPFTLANF